MTFSQWATAAAPCSSMRAPVVKRSRAKGSLRGCGAPVASVWAKVKPAAGVALKPPVPQPQLTNDPAAGPIQENHHP